MILTGRSIRVRLTLAGICLAHLVAVRNLHPTNFFGLSRDDAFSYGSSKALAGGIGYVLPSLPGSPAATKYPILYAWLMSWVWRWNSIFPANLSLAAFVSAIFGIAFLVMTFLFLRSLKGVNELGALLVTACCSIHPTVLLYDVNLGAELLFAAVCLGAIILAGKSIERDVGLATAACAGLVAGVSMLVRVLGVPVAAGLFLVLARRGGCRKALTFAVGSIPFFLELILHSILAAPVNAPKGFSASACSQFAQLTRLYYLNYLAFWKASAIDFSMLKTFVFVNLRFLVYQFGGYLIDLRQVRPSSLVTTLFVLVWFIVVRGLVRQIQLAGTKPIHFVFLLYIAPILIWDFASPERFLILFLPLILAGVWAECAHVAMSIQESMRRENGIRGWVATALCVLVGGALVVTSGFTWWKADWAIFDLSARRAGLLPEKREAYDWIRNHIPTDAKVIAYESASVFLYSNVQGMPPVELLPAAREQSTLMETQLSCMLATADLIGANYWVVSDDDFGLLWPAAIVRARTVERDLEKTYPLLFRSSEGHVRIYKILANLERPQTKICSPPARDALN